MSAGRSFEAAAKIEAAEQARLSGQPVYSIEESRKRLEAIYGQDL